MRTNYLIEISSCTGYTYFNFLRIYGSSHPDCFKAIGPALTLLPRKAYIYIYIYIYIHARLPLPTKGIFICLSYRPCTLASPLLPIGRSLVLYSSLYCMRIPLLISDQIGIEARLIKAISQARNNLLYTVTV